MGEGSNFPAVVTCRESRRAVVRFLLGAAAAFAIVGTAAAARFGDPPGLNGPDPPGYLMLLAAKHALMALERAFTSVIGAATGEALDAQLKQAIADGVVEGPRIMACGRWLITTGDSNDLPDYWWWGITELGSQRYCDGADECEFRGGHALHPFHALATYASMADLRVLRIQARLSSSASRSVALNP